MYSALHKHFILNVLFLYYYKDINSNKATSIMI